METTEPDQPPVYYLAAGLINHFSPEHLVMLLIILLLLFFSALFSGTEVAYFALNTKDRADIRADETKLSKLIARQLEKPRKILATILVANNFTNIAIVILASSLVMDVFNFSEYPLISVLIEVVVVTFLIVLFGEIIPKIYSAHNTLNLVRMMARPMDVLERICHPITYLLVSSSKLIDKKISFQQSSGYSSEELDDAIDLAYYTTENEEEVDMLKGIVKFGNISVKQIMRSRMDIIGVDKKLGFDELLKLVRDSGFSRIPVYENDIDNINAVLYTKDLIHHTNKGLDYPWQRLARKAYFVPETKKIDDLLRDFQKKRTHMAIAVDEYGGTAGLVTLEDIMEEIIGEIKDEYDDVADLEYAMLDSKNYIFEGKTLLNDICRVLDISTDAFDEVKGESDSLAGLLLELEGDMPERDATIRFRRYLFKVLSLGENRIKKVKITILPEDAADDASQ